MMGIMRILISVLLFIPVSGHAFTPTPAQIEAFKNLSPAEQKRLAEQYGVELPTSPIPSQDIVETPEIVKPRDAESRVVEDEFVEKNESQSMAGTDLKEDQKEHATKQELKQFGYDLFAGSPTTFAPATDIPVPVDYIIGPGDTVMVQLYGKENSTHELAVNREGVIQFPEIGPVTVAGQTYQELKEYLTEIVSRQMIGVKASITMGVLRSIRVFVLGEAYRPGSYTVSALSTMTNALFVSGGITKVGSLRNVQLKRKGELVGSLDLYDLLLRGDTSRDQRLLPGDVIFIPSIGSTVGVSGEVKRPAVYEIKDEVTASAVIALAGGYLPSAYPSASRVKRITDTGNRTIVDVDLTTPKGKSLNLNNGDVIQVYSVLDKMENVVLLSGHVHRPGGFSWRLGMRVTDIIGSYSELMHNPDMRYAIVKREVMPERKLSVIHFSLAEALSNPGSVYDPKLLPRDELVVFGLEESRGAMLGPVINRLKDQADYFQPANVVEVLGNVRFPAEYPYSSGLKVQDLIDAASGLRQNTDLDYALLVRNEKNLARVNVEHLNLREPAQLERNLRPLDRLYIFSLSVDRQKMIEPILEQLEMQAGQKDPLKIVSISGLVRFPGDYPLTGNMSIQDLIRAAGGYRESAYTLGAEITRSVINANKTKENERVQVNLVESSQQLLVSRDQLYIKKIPNWAVKETATISGEVNFPGVYPIYKGDTITDLVERAGGVTEYGDPAAAIFMREDLKKREQKQILQFKTRLEKDLAEMKLDSAKSEENRIDSGAIGETMLEQLTATRATGRLVIELPKLIKEESGRTVQLKDKDHLVIPRKSTEVSVVGEVQFPTSHFYESGLDVFDYINISGGFTSKSDDERIYIIKPSGKIVSVKNGWLIDRNTVIGPGDTVVVPYDTDAMSPMAYWVSVSQILFQLATTVAALDTVGVF